MRAYGLRNPIAVIPNGIDLPETKQIILPPPWEGRAGSGANVMLFLGRIHPKKGLENLIRAWRMVKDRGIVGLREWHLVIAGWSQGRHEDTLKQVTRALDVERDVTFVGPLHGASKDAALRAASAFALPSFSEGLPMSILEAWSYSLPVLMTPECNIPEGFAAAAAIAFRPEAESIAQGLANFVSMPAPARREMGINGRRLVESNFAWPGQANQMMTVYQWVLGRAPRPSCVRLDESL